MNHTPQFPTGDVQKKAFETPALRREARMPIITAGSFDLLIPNG